MITFLACFWIFLDAFHQSQIPVLDLKYNLYGENLPYKYGENIDTPKKWSYNFLGIKQVLDLGLRNDELTGSSNGYLSPVMFLYYVHMYIYVGTTWISALCRCIWSWKFSAPSSPSMESWDRFLNYEDDEMKKKLRGCPVLILRASGQN